MSEFVIRPVQPGEEAVLRDLILELADYEQLRQEVVLQAEDLHRDLFTSPKAYAVLGLEEGVPVGFALWFYNYSTFRGRKGLYLEDLYVQPAHRGKGYGKALLMHLVRLAKHEGCGRMEWSVLNWNAPAIAFYESLGAMPMKEWTVYRLDEQGIAGLCAG